MIIGIPTSTSKVQYYINQAYVDYVKEAGFEPLMINPKSDLPLMAAMCGGLLLPGGIDIDPTFYGLNNYSSLSVDPGKDMFERELLHLFIAEGKPIFGICRGLQLVAREFMLHFNIHRRLRFHQHVNDHTLNTDLSLARNVAAHSVEAKKDLLYGDDNNARYTRIFVNSMHHQCLSYSNLKKVDEDNVEEDNALVNIAFEILARTTYGLEKKDKFVIIEAFRIIWGRSRILAVQWHPEELKDLSLLERFFNHEEREVEQVNEMEV